MTVSEFRVSFKDVFILLLMLGLLLFSLLKFFFRWKKNYRMPEGVFYFEEKPFAHKFESTLKNSSSLDLTSFFQILSQTLNYQCRLCPGTIFEFQNASHQRFDSLFLFRQRKRLMLHKCMKSSQSSPLT